MASANPGNSYSNGSVNGSVVCLGEMLVDFVPTVPGLTLAESKSYEKAPGGAPANVAVAVSRLGGQSAMIGKVGEDSFGHMLVEMLIDNGVDSRGVRFDAAARTALAFVTLRSDGEREFMFYRNPSADMLLHESELHREIISHSSIFHFGSISLISEPCKSAHLAAMEIARKSGAILSYDVNLRLALWPSAKEAREGIMSLWEAVDIIKVSDNELEFLLETGSTTKNQKRHRNLDEAVQSVWKSNLKLLLLTEGRHGCRYYTQKFHGRVEGIEVEPVDTTGAGDAFMGGFLFQLAQDMHLYEDEKSLRGALVFANACGAIATMERGAIPALPCQESVLRLIHSRSMGRSGSGCAPHEQKLSNGNNVQSNGEPTMA